MPTYEFRCPKGHEFQKFYKTISAGVSELPCPECGALAVRQLSVGGLVFKGSGFYLTDYGKNAHRGSEPGKKSEGAAAEGTGGKTESGKGEGAKTEGSKSESVKFESAKSEGPKPKAQSAEPKAQSAEPKAKSPKPKSE